jgi:cytochrome c oxidase assembly protein subunit 11
MSDHPATNPEPTPPPRRQLGVALACAVFVVSMVGAAYAAVPLYFLFCRVTGYGGTTQVASHGAQTVTGRSLTVRFDANVGGGLPWDFAPEQRAVDIKVGATNLVMFRVTNRSDRVTWAHAVYNVTPETTGGYFDKIQCFCFTKQHLNPGESLEMPVVFFVDPAFDKDHEMDAVRTITLSYTFYPAEPDQPVARAAAAVPKI